jgi:ADP-heptose:LPS heptosyltransferase
MLGLGDVLVTTCAIRDFINAYEGKYRAIMEVPANLRAVYENNPLVAQKDKLIPHQTHRLCYGSSINQSNQRYAHFASAFHQNLSELTGERVFLTDMRPDMYLTDEERDRSKCRIKHPYWIVVAGGKRDYTAKLWDHRHWCTVSREIAKDFEVVQVGATGTRNIHRSVPGTTCLLGKTNVRELMRLVYHAEGVICPVTGAMHMAAGFNKPCIVVAGGREGWWWEAYNELTWKANCTDPIPDDFVPHAYLHTIGDLPCCRSTGCWKSGVGDKAAGKNCKDLVKGPSAVYPRCLDMITPSRVISVYEDYSNGIMPTFDQNSMPSHLLPPLFTEKLIKASEMPKAARLDRRPRRMGGTRKYSHQRRENKRYLLTDARNLAHKREKTISNERKLEERRKAVQSKKKAAVTKSRGFTPKKKRDSFKVLNEGLTIAVLLYGDYPELAERVVSRIYSTVHPEQFTLRLGLNEVSEATMAWLDVHVLEKFDNVILYNEKRNIFKYPLMRKMFHDTERPLDTDWTIWFDDDSHPVSDTWITDLDAYLAAQGAEGSECHMVGRKYYYHIRHKQPQWIKDATWYHGKPFRTDGRKSNKPKVDFATGGWWAVQSRVFKEADWPDIRLRNNGGDVMMGEACYQNGFVVKQYYKGINISNHDRRGASHRHPGM